MNDSLPYALLPFVVFIILTALKDLINDFRKSSIDNKINNKKVIVMNDLD